jgi:hypothetical protein
MAPSTTVKSSRPTRAAKNKAPASSATSTSAGGKRAPRQTTTTEATKAPSKRGRKPISTTATSTAITAAAAKGVSAFHATAAAADIGISAEDLAFYNQMSARLAAANKAQKEAADLGSVAFFFLHHCHRFKLKIYFLEISNRNAQLMAEEMEDQSGPGSEPEEDQAPAPKRLRRMILDHDEEEIASTLTSLPSLPQINSMPEEDIHMSEDEEQNHNASEDEQEEEIDQGDASQDAFNVDSGDWGSLIDNGVRFQLLSLLYF